MRRCPIVSAAVTALLLIALPPPASQAQDRPTLTREQQEAFLRTADVVSSKVSPDGITAPERATLSDGTLTHDAQIQDVDIFEREFKTRRGTEINFRDSYRYNIAASLLDEHLGLNMVPVCVERRVDGRACAVSWWVDDVLMSETARIKNRQRSPDPRGWASQMHVVRVFDQLIGNSDRHGGNLLITDAWDIWMIDHTRAFRTRKALTDPDANLEWCDRGLFEQLRGLTVESVAAIVGDHLTGPEIEGVAARAELLVDFFDQRITELGTGAVLYDLPRR